jgi:hypothetical protein
MAKLMVLKLSDYIKRVLEEEAVAPIREEIEEPVLFKEQPTTFNPHTPEEIQSMSDSGVDALYLTKRYKETPSAVVMKALREAPLALKSHALVHKNCPVEELVEATKNPIHHGAVSINPKTPPNILEQLSKSEFEHILLNVAGNKNTPKSVLHEMARKYKGHQIGDAAKNQMGKKK